jgi:circadian clock protein KaiB
MCSRWDRVVMNSDDKGKAETTSDEMGKAVADSKNARYVLRLYVTGTTPRSTRAVANIRKICEEYLKDRYELHVIDISQDPAKAGTEQIIAAPTLIRELPLPLRRFIGDMSKTENIIVRLDLDKV